MKKLRIFFALAFFMAAFGFFSCKQMIDRVDVPRINTNYRTPSKNILTLEGLKATQGKKRKISLSWEAIPNIKFYEIYYSDNPNSTFQFCGESQINSFEDIVGPGSTFYYKVRAKKNDGTFTDFSQLVKGTSLAVPIITGGNFDETTTATIYWHMENSRDLTSGEKNYEKDLKFLIFCEGGDEFFEKSFDLIQKDENGETILENDEPKLIEPPYNFKFENLDSNTKYTYYITAYLTSDQDSVETSEKVTAETLKNFVPASPVFTASEGSLKNAIELAITLPQMVFASVRTSLSEGEKKIEEYPLYFEIERKLFGEGEFEELCTLYYNGETSAPDTSTYSGNPYVAGAVIKYKDEKEISRGVKYEYRIKSYADTNYSEVIGADFNSVIGSKTSTEAQGWAAAIPNFSVKDINFEENESKNQYVSVSFGFSLGWDNLGSESEYDFAIEQTKKSFENESETTSFYQDKTFSMEEINQAKITISNFEEEQGYYSYTLYIFPKGIFEKGSKLLSQKAMSVIVASPSMSRPKPEITNIQSGYTDKVTFSFNVETAQSGMPEIKYYVERYEYEEDGSYQTTTFGSKANSITAQTPTPELTDATCTVSDKIATFTDSGVQSGKTYEYILYAHNGSFAVTSETAKAVTLGTPAPVFKENALAYDSVTLTLKQVPAAKSYKITLGSENEFGGGKTISFDKEGNLLSSNDEYSVTLSSDGIWTIILKKPQGFDDAKLAGKTATAKVLVTSEADATSEADVSVRVLGPAETNAQVNDFDSASEDKIILTWRKIEGAAGYLIRRVRYDDSGMTQTSDNAGDTYFCNAQTLQLKIDGNNLGSGTAYDKNNVERAAVRFENSTYTLTDNYVEADNSPEAGMGNYQANQAKIAWGLPYKYSVLPVFESEDFLFEESKFDLDQSASKVKYKNLSLTDGVATFGCGLDVVAEKSESESEQKISWKAPFYKNNLDAVLFSRRFGTSGAWAKNSTLQLENENASCTPKEPSNPYEYAVKYVKNATSTVKFPKSYTDYMRKKMDSKSETEPCNKGYLFTTGIEARYGGSSSKVDANYYSEIVSVTQWDYAERAIGPDSYEVEILNLNLLDGWTKVGTYDANFNFTSETLTDTTIEKVADGIRLKPTAISEGGTKKQFGTTEGPLKVLRSAKHFYRVKIKRQSSEGEVTALAGSDQDGKNPSVFAYRQITDEELVKCVMLIISDALVQNGIPDGDGRSTDGYTGRFYARHKGSSKTFHWGTENTPYRHIFRGGIPGNKNEQFVSGWTIKCSRKEYRSAADGNAVYYICDNDEGITVTHESSLASYQGTVNITAGKQGSKGVTEWSDGVDKDNTGTLKIVKDGTAMCDITKNFEEFKKWMPYELGKSHGSPVTAFNENFIVYQSPWWPAAQ